MGIARKLVELERRLRHEEPSLDLFAPNAAERLSALTYTSFLIESVPGSLLGSRSSVVRLALQALRIQHAEMEPNLLDAEFVATLPARMPSVARPTHQVIRSMLTGGVGDFIALGYEISDEGVIGLFQETIADGTQAVLICDRERGSANRILAGWPKGLLLPAIYQNRDRDGAAPYSSMHCKALLVDGIDLLITSHLSRA